MEAVRRIVIGVDLPGGKVSEGSRLAIDQARWMALRTGAHVTLLHSGHLDEHWDPASRTFEPSLEAVAAEVNEALQDATEALRNDGIEASYLITDSSAGLEILRCVQQEHADIVILGKRSQSETDGRPLGSTSQNVVRNCPCPVLVVKPGSSPTPAVIVAATDRSEVGRQVVDVAASIAERCESVLHVVHAIQIDFEAQMSGDAARDALIREQRAAFETEVAEQAAAAGFKGQVECHAGVTCPSRGVLEAEKQLQPDLIVMGTVARTGLPGVVLGNTAERLLGTLDTSLLVVKPAGFRSPLDLG
jgi:universal stress protein E